MTEPVEGVSRAKAVSEKYRRDAGYSPRGKHAEHDEGAEDDSIDISDEARDRSSGKKRPTILEYLKDESS